MNACSTFTYTLLVLRATAQEMVQKTAKADPRREEWIVSMMKQDGVSREVSIHPYIYDARAATAELTSDFRCIAIAIVVAGC
jgi:hypothetical protein